MLNKLQKRKDAGFTIVEVMIVLAIGGLIILVVFLAVPALQRSARNTTLRNDAATVLAAVNEFSTNNGGKLPTSTGITSNADGVVTISGSSGTSPVTTNVQAGTTVNGTGTMPTTAGAISIRINGKCNGNAFAGGTSSRAISAGFAVESANGVVPQCVES